MIDEEERELKRQKALHAGWVGWLERARSAWCTGLNGILYEGLNGILYEGAASLLGVHGACNDTMGGR